MKANTLQNEFQRGSPVERGVSFPQMLGNVGKEPVGILLTRNVKDVPGFGGTYILHVNAVKVMKKRLNKGKWIFEFLRNPFDKDWGLERVLYRSFLRKRGLTADNVVSTLFNHLSEWCWIIIIHFIDRNVNEGRAVHGQYCHRAILCM